MTESARENQTGDEYAELRELLKATLDQNSAASRLISIVLAKLDANSQSVVERASEKSLFHKFGIIKSDSAKKISQLEATIQDRENAISSLKKRLEEAETNLKNTENDFQERDAARENEISGLKKQLEAEKMARENSSRELGNLNAKLNKKIAEQNNTIKELNKKLAESEEEISRLAPLATPDLEELARVLGEIPKNFRDRIRLYYNIDDRLVFLSQCGKLPLIEQLWQRCSEAIRDGMDPANIADFLELLVKRHNLANPDDRLIIETPEQGSRYDYDAQYRVDSEGDRIDKVLLPGLASESGSRLAKALARLRR